MKILRYLDDADSVRFAWQDAEGSPFELDGRPGEAPVRTDRPAVIRDLLAPVVPTQILAIGLNYRKHAEETGAKIPQHPVLFVKTLNTLQHPGEPIRLPRKLASTQVDYECELAVVIGRDCRNATRENALAHVLGYTCANDVSARDWQKQWGGSQWCRGKSFDTFCPLGPCLVTPDDIPNPNALDIQTRVNGRVVQHSNTADMIFDIAALITFLSGSTTIPAGTVILTGTPSGVGMAADPPHWLQPGDTVEVEIEAIGTLTNPVIEETA